MLKELNMHVADDFLVHPGASGSKSFTYGVWVV